MTLQTNPAERREVVRAISERLGSPAVYLRMPTCAYRIGDLTVERDGSIASDDEALLETLRPMLMERGWLTESAAAADSEAEADTMVVYSMAPCWRRVSATRATVDFFWPMAT